MGMATKIVMMASWKAEEVECLMFELGQNHVTRDSNDDRNQGKHECSACTATTFPESCRFQRKRLFDTDPSGRGDVFCTDVAPQCLSRRN